jgi:hypothetical protein
MLEELLITLESTAHWRRKVAEDYPQDRRRNEFAAETLERLEVDIRSVADRTVLDEIEEIEEELLRLSDGNRHYHLSNLSTELSELNRRIGFSFFPEDGDEYLKSLLDIYRENHARAIRTGQPQVVLAASPLHQSSRAAIFTEAEGGVIGIAPPTPQDRLAHTPEVLDFYNEVREQTGYLATLGPNMLGPRLHQAVAKLQQCLPGSFEEAIERHVWSRGNALRVMLHEHDATASDPTHPHQLEPSAAETLRGLIQLFNQLAFADPSLRSRDARRPGPQEVDRASAGLRIAVEIIPGAAANRAITSGDAGAELNEQIEIAQRLDTVADDGLPGKLGREHAAETVGNFVSHVILWLRKAGVYVTKEVTSGGLRAAGATIFGSALAFHISPAIVTWFIASSEQLLAFGATFFEHVPAFRETVEWLREHIVNDGQTD